MTKVKVSVQSDKFGKSVWRTGQTSSRLDNLRKVQVIGAEIDPTTGGCQDVNGNVHFLVPEDKVTEFNQIVESFNQ